jgi:hypothetical protein
MSEIKRVERKPGNKFFSRINYQVQRGLRELLSERELSHAEWSLIKVRFGNRCAFCGIEDSGNPRTGLIPDHLVPTTENGEMCMGNIVPTCHDCNDKRGAKDWRSYLEANFPTFFVERSARIQSYLDEYNYSPPVDLSNLTEVEATEYRNILVEWEILWNRMRELRDNVKSRRKARIA